LDSQLELLALVVGFLSFGWIDSLLRRMSPNLEGKLASLLGSKKE